MSFVASWRTALRMARREVRRAKGRSILVVAMIAIPMLALTFAAVTYDMITLTGEERADRTMGAADARVQWPSHFPLVQLPDPGEGYHVDIVPKGASELNGYEQPGTEAELRAALPGSTVLPVRRGSVTVQTPNGFGQPEAVMIDANDPLARGYVEVMEGRAPVGATEVALTEQAMQWLQVGIGGTVTVHVEDDRTQPYTVVGRVEFPAMLTRILLFAYHADDEAVAEWFDVRSNSWFVDTPEPISWQRVQELNGQGMLVSSRAVLVNPPPDAQVPLRQRWYSGASVDVEGFATGVLAAGLALLEVVLLAGPAFAVSARRRQRQLALVAANGGTPAHLRRIMLADGVVLGLIGAATGIVVGIAGAFAARPWVEELLTHERAGGYRVFPEALLAIAGLAVVTGLAAAMIPAFVTARQSVVASLAGRRGVTRSRKRWIAVGLAMIGVGAALTTAGALQSEAVAMLAGMVVAELGVVMCTPALVGLIARAGQLLPLAPRIALRDAGRNRAAAAPAISAVMAAVAGSVALGMVMDSDRERARELWSQEFPTGTVSAYLGDGRAPAEAVERTVRSLLPVADVHYLGGYRCPDGLTSEDSYCNVRVVLNDLCPQAKALMAGGISDAESDAANANPYCDPRNLFEGTGSGAYVASSASLATLTGASGDDLRRAQEALDAGMVVVRSPLQITDGMVELAVVHPDPDAPVAPEEPDWTGIPPGHTRTALRVPGYLLDSGTRGAPILPPQVVEQAGLVVTEQSLLVASTTRMPTEAEEERLVAALAGMNTWGRVERGFRNEVRPEVLLLIGAAALITIGAAGVGTGLAAADGRSDLSTLAAVGASPRLRRMLSLSQSAVIAGLGAVLGSIAGLGAAYAIIVADNQQPWVRLWPGIPMEPVLPWSTLIVVLIVVPLIATLGAGLLTRSRLPIERRL